MATYTPAIVGTNGRPKKVAATVAGSADTIYTVGTDKTELFLTAWNIHTAEVKLTLMLGGTTNPDDYLEIYFPQTSGPVPILEGHRFGGSVAIKAFADVANKIMIIGDANVIT